MPDKSRRMAGKGDEVMFQRKTPYEREWAALQKKEARLLENRETKQTGLLNRKLEGKVPPKMQQTLDAAFEKAFALVFDKGFGVIEKTYNKEELGKEYRINSYTYELKKSKKALRAFSNKAAARGNINLLLSGASGACMGALGIGLPDIPVFTAIILRSICEISLSYGFDYDSKAEKAFMLLIIEGAVSYGEQLKEADRKLDLYIETGRLADDYSEKEQIKATASSLSRELLYMKFLQGIPIVGVAGGLHDAVYMKRISEYAILKYKKRFLLGQHTV